MSSRQSNYECVQQVTQLHNLIAVKQAAVKTSNFPRSFLLDSNESLLKGSQDPPPHDLSLSLSLSLQQQNHQKTQDIFTLGCCHHSSFPLCFLN
jgi:hypothetical protein